MIRFLTGALVAVVLGVVLVGCHSDSELSPDKEKELRHNFNRALTPEEVAQLNGGGGKKATEGAGRPARTKG